MLAHQATKPRDSQRRQPSRSGVALTSCDSATAWSMRCAQLLREVGVAHHDVGLQVEQQRQRVDVGAAHGGPVVVDHRHLGMQEGRGVLVDAHAVRQQLVVQHARRQRRPGGSRACPAAAGARARRAAPRAAARGGRRGPGRSTGRRCRRGRARRGWLRCSCARWRGAGAGCRARRRPRAPAACGSAGSAAPAHGRTRRSRSSCSVRGHRLARCAPAHAPRRAIRARARRASHSARAMCCTGCTTGPRSSTAKSSRGSSVRPWRRSMRSSMMLMPPTKATASSTTHSFWCRRRSWPGCNQANQRSSGRNTSSATPSAGQPAPAGAAAWPWSRNRRPPRAPSRRAAPRRAAPRPSAWPASSSWKM